LFVYLSIDISVEIQGWCILGRVFKRSVQQGTGKWFILPRLLLQP